MNIDDGDFREIAGITLNDLFTAAHSGKSIVARDNAGNLRTVETVERGLACDCVCTVCGRALIARKGQKQSHHFAHQRDELQPACSRAGETILHLYAKELLSSERRIYFPAITVEDELGPLEMTDGRHVDFEAVELEVHMGEIVPDVVASLRGRRLFIEFSVTHPCSDEKLQRFKKHDAGVLEIDLSPYRNRSLRDIDHEIITNAPRKVLQSRVFEHSSAALLLRRKRYLEETLHLIGEFEAAALPEEDHASSSLERHADLLLDDKTITAITAHPAVWKSHVLALLNESGSGVHTRAVVDRLGQKGWIHPRADELDGTRINFIRQELKVALERPYEHVEQFLWRCTRRGVLRCQSISRWSYVRSPAKSRFGLNIGHNGFVTAIQTLAARTIQIAETRSLIAPGLAFDSWFAEEIDRRANASKMAESDILDDIHLELVELAEALCDTNRIVSIEALRRMPIGSLFSGSLQA